MDFNWKDYYKRKTKEGKHVMCVLNVIRAKLVHRMFSVIKRDTEYTKEYKPVSYTHLTLPTIVPV